MAPPLPRRRLVPILAIVALAAVVAGVAAAGRWLPLAADGVHDPSSPAIGVLQEPAEALASLPPDAVGNQVRWAQALAQGLIRPRATLDGTGSLTPRDTEVILRNTGEMPMVRFPHAVHTAWLDCASCHDQLFERAAGATRITMGMILRGEKCGVCHGAVSFPLTECRLCHSVERAATSARDGPR